MAIVQGRKPPPSGPQAIGRALRDLQGRPEKRELLGGAQIDLSAPLPVYRLGLDEIDNPDFLQRVKQVGWRYLIESASSGGVAYADVKETADGGSKFTSLSHNRNADRLMEAAHLAQEVAAGLPDDCEARILDVPAIYVSSVWLNCKNPIFIPYIYPPQFGDNKIQVHDDFLQQLQRTAQIAKPQIPYATPG